MCHRNIGFTVSLPCWCVNITSDINDILTQIKPQCYNRMLLSVQKLQAFKLSDLQNFLTYTLQLSDLHTLKPTLSYAITTP